MDLEKQNKKQPKAKVNKVISLRDELFDILDILLIDRTKSTNAKTIKNIIWANDNYAKYDPKKYDSRAEITRDAIVGKMNKIIQPRALKPKTIQKERTRSQAEVFTPTSIVKEQNDQIDKHYRNDDLDTYTNRTWLEITCGEAPYMVSRYDMISGKQIPLKNRVGFLDRKLKRINKEVNNKSSWNKLVLQAYKASYGFELSGDSLFLARENLFYTYCDYYIDKWNKNPSHKEMQEIAEIISYNVFQMDGLKCIIPFSDEEKVQQIQQSLFGDLVADKKIKKVVKTPVMVMNWSTGKLEVFKNDATK